MKGNRALELEEADDAPKPLEFSIAYQLRRTHRRFQLHLHQRLLEYDVPIGMWYFLRVLWEEDGLSQRELGRRVTATAPTTVEQLRNMEARSFIRRERTDTDRRKILIFLTEEGKALRPILAPLANQINRDALRGLNEGEVGFLRLVLQKMEDNLAGGEDLLASVPEE